MKEFLKFTVDRHPIPQEFTEDRRIVTSSIENMNYIIYTMSRMSWCVTTTEKPILLVVRTMLPVPDEWSDEKREQAIRGEVMPIIEPDVLSYVKDIEYMHLFNRSSDQHSKSAKKTPRGVPWMDNSQIVGIIATKSYSGNPRTEFEIYEIDNVEDIFAHITKS